MLKAPWISVEDTRAQLAPTTTNLLHAVLNLGFVVGLARVRGQRRYVVVRGKVVVEEVDVRFVARGLRNTAEYATRWALGHLRHQRFYSLNELSRYLYSLGMYGAVQKNTVITRCCAITV